MAIMELKGNLLPGYRVYEYMLIINPHEALQEKIKAIRADFEKEFKIEHKMARTMDAIRNDGKKDR
jgi:hypothetical protein